MLKCSLGESKIVRMHQELRVGGVRDTLNALLFSQIYDDRMILRQKKFNQFENFKKLKLWEKSEQGILNI